FHIVQHLNRFFDAVRKRVMKTLDQKDPIQAKQYRQLKSLFKLLLKSEDRLDYNTLTKRRNYNWRLLTETEVVDRLLKISPELKTAYRYYQDLLTAYQEKDPDTFFQLLRAMPGEVPLELHHIKKAFFKYEKGIRLALLKKYSNARLENLHTGFCCKVLNLLSNKVE
ncbi:ISL3 family transposase, partial [Enterococcus faecium]|uniref:transposase n=1 Tax=Enterococcus faecium TaxID=1352 RepID=UPI000E001AC2